jgi:hypothetical protein
LPGKKRRGFPKEKAMKQIRWGIVLAAAIQLLPLGQVQAVHAQQIVYKTGDTLTVVEKMPFKGVVPADQPWGHSPDALLPTNTSPALP